MTELICIACPKGCRLTVDDDLNVSGSSCPRGDTYGKNEVQNPVRTVTSTVRAKGALHRRCPVKTSAPIPKSLVLEAVQMLDAVSLTSPVSAGHVVIANICGTGVDFVTTREV